MTDQLIGILALTDPALRRDPEPANEQPWFLPFSRIQPVRERLQVRGKFLFAGDRKFWIKGVTYGTFAQGEGNYLPSPETVKADFSQMVASGINAVRVYTVPPRWLLDIAAVRGLRVLVGMPWEQHVAFMDDAGRMAAIRKHQRLAVREIAGHPAILAYAVGNEIPASVVRWHGARKVERFLRSLAAIARQEDPGCLVTYVNFPTTEYLDTSFADFLAFNVYLENQDCLSRYLARLQNLAGERPLVMAEIGLDSARNGVDRQATALSAQLMTAFESGCAGTFVFAWTDEWHRGGHDIRDWDFGLVTRDRRPKPALHAISASYATAPLPDRDWPLISVVVCSFNGAATIEETLKALSVVDYPRKQVIVIDDGSTDATAEIAGRYDVELVSTTNCGLSSARNTGMDMARGEIIAYLDDDAYPDPHWLKYLAIAFEDSRFAAAGGPNLAPPGDGDIAECVANAPGGPAHVLSDDQCAEHIPGCNMAFRTQRLREIGGFDPQFRVAGDDVDACWRIQQAGGVIGFRAAALVWHHRRPSIARYFKQQMGYARAELQLSQKWPQKYNAAGHLTWQGQLYGRGLMKLPFLTSRIYHGQWNSAPFQSVYAPANGLVASLPLMPEWYFLMMLTACLALLGFSWTPLLWMFPVFTGMLLLSLAMAVRASMQAEFARETARQLPEWKMRAVVCFLHLAQPLVRLVGRIQHGLGPWNRRQLKPWPVPRPSARKFWSEEWKTLDHRLHEMAERQRAMHIPFATGGATDPWDFAYQTSIYAVVKVVTLVEEHGSGRQLFRMRARPEWFAGTWLALTGLVISAGLAALEGAVFAASVLAVASFVLAALALAGAAQSMRLWEQASQLFGDPENPLE